MHYGHINWYLFGMNGKNVTLIFLSPRQVHEDQVRLKPKRAKMRNRELRKEGKAERMKEQELMSGKEKELIREKEKARG